jgi:hypothetical protein
MLIPVIQLVSLIIVSERPHQLDSNNKCILCALSVYIYVNTREIETETNEHVDASVQLAAAEVWGRISAKVLDELNEVATVDAQQRVLQESQPNSESVDLNSDANKERVFGLILLLCNSYCILFQIL